MEELDRRYSYGLNRNKQKRKKRKSNNSVDVDDDYSNKCAVVVVVVVVCRHVSVVIDYRHPSLFAAAWAIPACAPGTKNGDHLPSFILSSHLEPHPTAVLTASKYASIIR